MKNSVRRVLSSLAAIAAAVACTTTVAAPASAADSLEYVALGDSYSAGVGTLVYDDSSGSCRRSPLGYPAQWAQSHPAYTFKNVSCSGATIADVEADQLSTLSSETDRVTITVGGNDVGFASTMQNCLTGTDFLCNVSTQLSTYYAEQVLPGRMDALFAEIAERAPNARVYVLGYPHLLAPAGTCDLFSSTSTRPTGINAAADAVDAALWAAADKVDFGFLDVRALFAGHEACGPSPWINTVNLSQPAESFHPNATGYAQAYLPVLNLFMG